MPPNISHLLNKNYTNKMGYQYRIWERDNKPEKKETRLFTQKDMAPVTEYGTSIHKKLIQKEGK